MQAFHMKIKEKNFMHSYTIKTRDYKLMDRIQVHEGVKVEFSRSSSEKTKCMNLTGARWGARIVKCLHWKFVQEQIPGYGI